MPLNKETKPSSNLIYKVDYVCQIVCLKPMDSQIVGHRKLQFGMKDHFSTYIILIISENHNLRNRINPSEKLFWGIYFLWQTFTSASNTPTLEYS